MQAKFKDAHIIWFHDFEALAKELYGIEFDFMDSIPNELVGQNTYHDWKVDGESEFFGIEDEPIYNHWIRTGEYKNIDATALEPLENDIEYWNDYEHVNASHILHRMFLEGHIKAGTYIITVYW